MKRWWHAFLLVSFALVGAAASGHEMSMAEMEVHETSKGEFVWQWVASGSRPASQDLVPVWPEGCQSEANLLRCGAAGMQGKLSIDGVGKRYSAALVKVFWLDGPMRIYTLTSGQPTVQLYGSADDRRDAGQIASAYTVLGIEHILGGFDHLMFVVGLLFLVGFRRRLVWTISAFTAAHSVTLIASALGLLTLRSAPVEAAIAMSIVLMAAEALRRTDTLTRRWPALVAFGFGLLHGLGFAGALKEIGLPDNHLLMALLTFNVGVEIGQLLTVGTAWLLFRLVCRQAWAPALARPALYSIGTLAAYWSWLRIAAVAL